MLKSIVPYTKYQKTILIIRPDGLGDLLVSLESIATLYRHFHPLGYKVVVIHSQAMASILEQCPFVDETISLDNVRIKCNISYKISFYRKLMLLAPEYVINYLFLPRPEVLDHKLVLFSCARHKCTIDARSFIHRDRTTFDYSTSKGSRFKEFAKRLLPNEVRCKVLLDVWSGAWRNLYDICPMVPERKDIFEILNNLVSEVCGIEYSPEPIDLSWIRKDKILVEEGSYYVIVPSSNVLTHSWTPEKFSDLIRRFAVNYPKVVPVITGTKFDVSLAETIIKYLPKELKVLNLCGKTSILQLFSLVQNSLFVVGNDTGTSHVAGILDKANIVIGGGWHYGLYFPNGKYKKCRVVLSQERRCFFCNGLCYGLKNGRYPCVYDVDVSQVLDEMNIVIQQN